MAGAAYWYTRPQKSAKPASLPPVRVVHDRPGVTRRIEGAKISEAEAVLILRRHFGVPDNCLATIANGASGKVYRFTAFNTCDRTRLGRWEVDGWSKAVTP